MLTAFEWLINNWTTEKGKADAVMVVTGGREDSDSGGGRAEQMNEAEEADGEGDGVMDVGLEPEDIMSGWKRILIVYVTVWVSKSNCFPIKSNKLSN